MRFPLQCHLPKEVYVGFQGVIGKCLAGEGDEEEEEEEEEEEKKTFKAVLTVGGGCARLEAESSLCISRIAAARGVPSNSPSPLASRYEYSGRR